MIWEQLVSSVQTAAFTVLTAVTGRCGVTGNAASILVSTPTVRSIKQ